MELTAGYGYSMKSFENSDDCNPDDNDGNEVVPDDADVECENVKSAAELEDTPEPPIVRNARPKRQAALKQRRFIKSNLDYL